MSDGRSASSARASRLAATTRTRLPPESRASAASSSPWTVRLPGCTWKPAKSVPSYSTRAAYRTRPPSRADVAPLLDELDLDDRRCVAWSLPDADDPGVTGAPVAVAGSDLLEELVDDERLIRQLRDDPPPRSERAFLGKRDDALDLATDLLGTRLGRLHLLVAEDRHDQVAVQGHPRPVRPSELAPVDPVGHRSGLLDVLVVLVLEGRGIEVGRLVLGDEEAAHAEALLHLVERLLAEVAHPQQVVVGQLQQLADLDDVVALQRVVGPHRQVQVLDRHVEHVRRELRRAAHHPLAGGDGLAGGGEEAELTD